MPSSSLNRTVRKYIRMMLWLFWFVIMTSDQSINAFTFPHLNDCISSKPRLTWNIISSTSSSSSSHHKQRIQPPPLPPQQQAQKCVQVALPQCRVTNLSQSINNSNDDRYIIDNPNRSIFIVNFITTTTITAATTFMRAARWLLSLSSSSSPSIVWLSWWRQNQLQISQQIRKFLRRTMISFYITSSILLSRPIFSYASTSIATTPTVTTITTAKSKTSNIKPMSLRPGMSKTLAEALEQGDTTVVQQFEQAPSIFQSSSDTEAMGGSTKTTTSKTTTTKQKGSTAFSDYGESMDDEENDDDDDADLMQLINEDQFGKPKVATQTDKALGEKLQASSKDQFAAYHQGKSFGLTLKVGIAFFAPTYGFMIGREYVRRRREERYVKKGLEILEAQKAEYFNITNTKNDVDVEDELKNLKNKNSTNTDDDDEDSDDDDDDDDENDDDDNVPPPSASRRPPRKPLGDPPKNSGGSSGGGSSSGNSGNSKPSAADIEKLNKLLGKS